MSESDDPLDGAAVGEKRTVRRSKTIHGINFEPMAFVGQDREGDVHIVEVEVIESDEDGCDDIRVTWEAEMMKTLPRRWDHCREPRTETERKEARRKRWLRRGAKAAAVLIPGGVSMAVALVVMNRVAGEMTINGEPVFVDGMAWVSMLGLMASVSIIAWISKWAVEGGIPPRMGAGRR